ncbi:hypothetical protein OG828_47395 [Streptomyces sp. NBC_00457]|uniref:hypothetical protein n=1 Tax=Streptomyces sp. NBC_00457 TaxID=2975748 RepID=UPI002E232C85
MTMSYPVPTSTNDVRTPDTVAQAEAAWLVAITKGDEEQRQLVLPDEGRSLGHMQLSLRQPPA